MKITIYELLGLVKDGKAPRKFKYDGYVWTYNYESSAYWNGKSTEFEDYMDDGLMKYLNDEIEILEEEKKIPEKFKIHSLGDKDKNGNFVSSAFPTDEEFMNKINEVIDYLDYLKNKGE